jgi:hypothetical protein
LYANLVENKKTVIKRWREQGFTTFFSGCVAFKMTQDFLYDTLLDAKVSLRMKVLESYLKRFSAGRERCCLKAAHDEISLARHKFLFKRRRVARRNSSNTTA